MRLAQLMALAFVDETNKIASDIQVPINQLSIKEAAELVEDFFEKEAATRAVKEWRKADAAGDTGTADAIAKGYGDLNLKPRYLKDVSIGGAEAGVDQMMGDVRHSTGQMPSNDPVSHHRALDRRLDAMKANKEELGLEGRLPTQSVKSSPEGRGALLRGMQGSAFGNPTPPGAAPNESGYIARKMYKPDSYITQAEFTPQLMQQKMDMTQTARSLSPEAKSMVPDMYGYKTTGAGPKQRTMSYHEYVPGMQDLRDQKNPEAHVEHINQTVLSPLHKQTGATMGDVTGERGTNWGNVAMTPQGPKVVDFQPVIPGKPMVGAQSFMKYAPMPGMRHSEEGGAGLGDLRKEMYKPTMESRPATFDQVRAAAFAHNAQGRQGTGPATAPPGQARMPTPQPDPFKKPPTPAPVSGVAPTAAAPASGFARTAPAMQPAATNAAVPQARRPSPAVQPAATSPAAPQARPATPAPRPAAPAPAMQPMRTGAASPGALRPGAMRPAAPSFHLPTKPVLGGLHR